MSRPAPRPAPAQTRNTVAGTIAGVPEPGHQATPPPENPALKNYNHHLGAMNTLFDAELRTGRRDLSGLRWVLDVDRSGPSVDVQGLCDYGTVLHATLPYGLVPKVVPDRWHLTAVEAVTGHVGGTASFRHGSVADTVLDAEIVDASGLALIAVRGGEHKDLFDRWIADGDAAGLATRIRLEAEPARRLVTFRHRRLRDAEAAHQAYLAATAPEAGWHFVDRLTIEGAHHLCTGRFVDISEARRLVLAPTPLDGRPETYLQAVLEEPHAVFTTTDYLYRWEPRRRTRRPNRR